MKPDTTIPKDYAPVARTIEPENADHPAIGYDTDGHAEAVCDSYRLHWEHDPIRPEWQQLAVRTVDHTATYYVDKALLDWCKVAKKCACTGENGVTYRNRIYRCAVHCEPDALRVPAPDTGFGTASAAFARPLPVPDEWREQYGIDPVFLLDALQYVTRGKRQEITVTTHGPMIQFHNCTRHALVMPKRINN